MINPIKIVLMEVITIPDEVYILSNGMLYTNLYHSVLTKNTSMVMYTKTAISKMI